MARAFVLSALAVLTSLVLAGRSQAAIESPPPPQVWSDKADYSPGETVTLSGANWAPGEAVHLVVNDDAGQTWRYENDVTASSEGTFSDQFALPDWFVAVYHVTATGASGTATWSFTDGTVRVRAVNSGGASVPITWVRYSNTACDPGPGNVNVVDSGSFNAVTGGNGTTVEAGSSNMNLTSSQSLRMTAGAVSGFVFSNWSNGSFTTGTFTPSSNPGCLVGTTGTQNTQVNYVADNTAPTVSSINRSGSSPTNAGTVQWAVTFSESVTGVNAGDFALAEGGSVSGASITSVGGGGASYTVTASTGTGDGTFGLNLVDDDSVVDAALNKLGGTGAGNGNFTGQVYGVDKTAPTVSVAAVTLPDDAAYSADSWTNKSVRVTFTCSDSGGSGLTADSGNETQEFTADTSGTTATFSGTCADNAGNVAGGASFGPIEIDKTAPTISASHAPAPNAAGWNNSDVTVSYTCADGLSGLDPAYGNDGAGCWQDDVASSEGLTQFTNRAVFDRAGNSASVSPVVRIDKTPPTITATLTPAPNANGWNNTDVTVEFDCFDSLSGLNPAYGNDGAGCWNDETVTDEGLTTFVNRTAFDNADNFASIDVDVRIDKNKPDSSAASPAYSNANSFTVSYNASDGLSGLEKVELWAKAPGAASYSKVDTDSTPTASGSFAYTAADGDGSYAFYTRAVDRADNYEDAPAGADTTTFVDTVAPDTLIDSHPDDPTNATSASFAFHGDDPAPSSGLAGFECKLDGGAWTACTSPQGYSSLADGSHTFSVRASDNAGNTDGTPDAFTWLVDTVKPSSSASSPAFNNQPTIHVTYTAADNAGGSGLQKVELWVKGPGEASYSLAATDTSGAASGSFDYAVPTDGLGNLVDGTYRFYTIAVDNAGNRENTPATPDGATTQTVQDSVAPDTSITAQPSDPSNSDSASFGFTHTDALPSSGLKRFECSLDGGAWSTCTSPQTYDSLSEGSHTFAVRAVDNAENADGSAASFTWFVDTVAPDTLIDSHPDDPTNATSASFAFHGEDPAPSSGLAGFECKLDGGAWTACTNPQGYSSLADGSHTFSVRASDNAGNTDGTPDAFTWLVDTLAPVTTDDAPSGWSNTAVTVQLTATDGGSGVDETYYRVDADPTFTAGTSAHIPAPADHSNDGAHTIHYYSTDNAGNTESVKTAMVRIDTEAPTIAFHSRTPGPNSHGWNNENVTVKWDCSDTLSGAKDAHVADTKSAEGGNQTAHGTCEDNAGNTASASLGGISIDKTAPSLNPSISPPPPLLLGASATASPNASDALSGVDTASCGPVDTSSVGTKSVSCSATDTAGNTRTVSISYSVIYDWRGFFQPVDNLPALNKAKAGSAIPVKFSLGGNQGLNIFMSGYPSSSQVTCGSTANADLIEQTVTAGSSTLQYDATADQYVYVWKTQSGWAGTCRTLTVKLVDGTVHQANFFFVR